MAVESVFQPVRHDLKLHYLLAYRNVGLGDVDLHFRVIDLIGQAVSDHLREVPETANNGFKDSCLDIWAWSCGEDIHGRTTWLGSFRSSTYPQPRSQWPLCHCTRASEERPSRAACTPAW